VKHKKQEYEEKEVKEDDAEDDLEEREEILESYNNYTTDVVSFFYAVNGCFFGLTSSLS
jgi:hypothetical protein